MKAQIDEVIGQLSRVSSFIEQAAQAEQTLNTLNAEIAITQLALAAYKARLSEVQIGLSEAEQTNIRVYNEAIAKRLAELDSINAQIASAQNVLNSVTAKASS